VFTFIWSWTFWLLMLFALKSGSDTSVTIPLLMTGGFGPSAAAIVTTASIGGRSAIPTGALAEELGWRGFLLPQLRKNRGAAVASLIIGVVWFSWHAPLFWSPIGTIVSGQPVTMQAVSAYFGFVVGVSFLFTWLYENTSGSVLLAVLFHASINAGIPFVLFPDLTLAVGASLGEAHRASMNLAILPSSRARLRPSPTKTPEIRLLRDTELSC
jgi:membrane protease YdiL (CAAX protease family)